VVELGGSGLILGKCRVCCCKKGAAGETVGRGRDRDEEATRWGGEEMAMLVGEVDFGDDGRGRGSWGGPRG
jgi:hypothetical protein